MKNSPKLVFLLLLFSTVPAYAAEPSWFYATRSRVPVWRTAQEAAQAEAFSNPSSPNPFSTSGEGGKESTTNSPSPQVEKARGAVPEARLPEAERREGGGLKPLDLLMKYDRVKLYSTNGAYARIGLAYPTKKAASINSGHPEPVEGYVPTNALAEWRVDVFFTNKDNIFPVESNITLYVDPYAHGRAMPAEGQDGREAGRKGTETAGVIEKGDTMRVLQGNGSRFMVATKSGKTGWVDLSWLQTEKLVAKGFEYKDTVTYPRKQLKVSTGFPINQKQYQLLDEGRIDEMIYYGGSGGWTLVQGEKSTDIRSYFNYIGSNEVVIYKNIECYHYRNIYKNYYGLILVLDSYIPKIFRDKLEGYIFENPFESDPEDRRKYPFNDDLKKMIGENKNQAILSFYTMELTPKLVNSFEIEGVFDSSLSFGVVPGNMISKLEVLSNNLILKFQLIGGGIDLRLIDFAYGYDNWMYDNNNGKLTALSDFKGHAQFLAPSVPITLKISKEEFEKSGLAMNDFNDYLSEYIQRNKVSGSEIAQNEDKLFSYIKSNLIIEINGNQIKYNGDPYTGLEVQRNNIIYNNGIYYVYCKSILKSFIIIYNNSYQLLLIMPIDGFYTGLIREGGLLSLVKDNKYFKIDGSIYEY